MLAIFMDDFAKAGRVLAELRSLGVHLEGIHGVTDPRPIAAEHEILLQRRREENLNLLAMREELAAAQSRSQAQENHMKVLQGILDGDRERLRTLEERFRAEAAAKEAQMVRVASRVSRLACVRMRGLISPHRYGRHVRVWPSHASEIHSAR